MRARPARHSGLLAAALLAFVPLAWGQTERLRDQGPLEISADRAELARSGVMQYSGNVELTTATLRVTGDALRLERDSDGAIRVAVEGAPATLNHEATGEGEDTQAVDAQAERIQYNRAEGLITLQGDVVLRRGGDRLVGETLRYSLLDQRITASGAGEGNRVRITIDPQTIERTQE